jgi:hypothetical protein
MRAYSIDDLTVSWLLSHCPNGMVWLRHDRFDATRSRCTIWTHDGNSFTFDVRTGEIVSRFVLWRWAVGVLLTAGVIVLAARYLSRRFRRVAVPAPSLPEREQDRWWSELTKDEK